MKTNTVQSKYKNPDKHILKLKAEIANLENSRDYWQEEYHSKCEENEKLKKDAYGEHLFTYGSNSIVENGVANFRLNELRNAKIGKILWIKAKIVKVVRTVTPSENIVRYRLLSGFVRGSN